MTASTIGTGKTLVLTYDDLHRLTRASTTAASSTPFLETYAYSSIGNITNKSDQGAYTYAETNYANPHAATAINGVSLAYDNNGNLTSYGTTSFSWDYRNQLTQAGNGIATSTYKYDHGRNRVSQTAGGVTTRYANKLYSTTGATTTKYIFAGDVLIATIEGSGSTTNATTTNVVHTDHLGGTHSVSSATGTVVQALDYYPYGALRINTQNTGFDGKRKYASTEHDNATGLNYMMARYQNPNRGQFLSQDPVFWEVGQTGDGRSVLQNPQAQNSYSYAGNSPVVKRDPEGRLFWSIPIILGVYNAVSTAIDLFDAYTTNIAYPDAFSQNEKQETLVKVGFDAVTQAIPLVKILAPNQLFRAAYDVLGISVDVINLLQDNSQRPESDKQPDHTSNISTPTQTHVPTPSIPAKSVPSSNNSTNQLQEPQRQVNDAQKQIDTLKRDK